MAVSQIEEKILGRIARQTEATDPLLAASLYQLLGLSILLSTRLIKARRLRKLDTTRDTPSLKLYHHIIWLAREGLSITETHILALAQDGSKGPEVRVMAAKLRASLYHVFCLFHNHPPVGQLGGRSPESAASPSSALSVKANNIQTRQSPSKSSKNGKENVEGGSRRVAGRSALRDPIPSMNSDTSYVTNPYAAGGAGASQTPPLVPPPSSVPLETRRTPTRPPGLAPVNIPEAQAAALFLLPPLNFVPMARECFETAQDLATSLLTPAHALRLSISLEHSAFLWDCCKETRRARHLARKTIREVYESTEGLDDEEFEDASMLVQALGGIVRREGATETSPDPPGRGEATVSPMGQPQRQPIITTRQVPPIDRTIAVSPANKRNRTESPSRTMRPVIHTPERLSTVPEVESASASPGNGPAPQATMMNNTSGTTSRGSSRNRQRRSSNASTAASEKASKRRAVEQAEDLYRRTNSTSGGTTNNNGTRSTPSNSRTTTPTSTTTRTRRGENNHNHTQQDGYVAKPKKRRANNRSGGNE